MLQIWKVGTLCVYVALVLKNIVQVVFSVLICDLLISTFELV